MEGRDCSPGENADCDVFVGGEDFVAEGHPFEGDVEDVEDGEEPVELVVVDVEVLGQAGDAGVAWRKLDERQLIWEKCDER